MILGTLRASLLGNVLTGKGIVRSGYGNKQGKGILRAGYGSQKVLIPPHPLTNIEIQKYYQKESRFNGVFSRDNLSKNVNDSPCLINLGEYADVSTHWIALYQKIRMLFIFVPKEIRHFIGNKNLETNIYRIQVNNLVLCGYFCIGFIDFMIACKTLNNYTSLFSPYDFKKNDKILLRHFKK